MTEQIKAPQPIPDTGGPAFPHPDYLHAGPWGMSMRDYFAAKAMQGVIANANLHEWEPNGRPLPAEWVADFVLMSYQLADAMLKARQA